MMQVVVLNMEILVKNLISLVDYSRLRQFYHLSKYPLDKNLGDNPRIMNPRKMMIMIAKKKAMKTKQLTNPQLEEGVFKLVLTYDQELLINNHKRKRRYLRLTRMMTRWRMLFRWMDLILPKSHRTCKIRKRQRNSQFSSDLITFKRKRNCCSITLKRLRPVQYLIWT